MTVAKRCDIVSIPQKGVNFFALFIISGFVLTAKREIIYRNKNGGVHMRVKVTLACTECKQRNYNTMKNKKNTPDRLEMNKYCPFCKKHTLHRETK